MTVLVTCGGAGASPCPFVLGEPTATLVQSGRRFSLLKLVNNILLLRFFFRLEKGNSARNWNHLHHARISFFFREGRKARRGKQYHQTGCSCVIFFTYLFAWNFFLFFLFCCCWSCRNGAACSSLISGSWWEAPSGEKAKGWPWSATHASHANVWQSTKGITFSFFFFFHFIMRKTHTHTHKRWKSLFFSSKKERKKKIFEQKMQKNAVVTDGWKQQQQQSTHWREKTHPSLAARRDRSTGAVDFVDVVEDEDDDVIDYSSRGACLHNSDALTRRRRRWRRRQFSRWWAMAFWDHTGIAALCRLGLPFWLCTVQGSVG